jgi:hypothetical protein
MTKKTKTLRTSQGTVLPDVLSWSGVAKLADLGKPRYKDGCGHDPSEFMGTIIAQHDGTPTFFDVYAFDDHSRKGRLEVCLRYGDEGWEYISPGTLGDVINGVANPLLSTEPHWEPREAYVKAVVLVLKNYEILARKRKKPL